MVLTNDDKTRLLKRPVKIKGKTTIGNIVNNTINQSKFKGASEDEYEKWTEEWLVKLKRVLKKHSIVRNRITLEKEKGKGTRGIISYEMESERNKRISPENIKRVSEGGAKQRFYDVCAIMVMRRMNTEEDGPMLQRAADYLEKGEVKPTTLKGVRLILEEYWGGTIP